ncbi:MAG: DUF2281 domain-containing protein [Saprospiraceae bacterium]|nr:DUF2281 domain-containing protein [Saprospiraceae bacterium]
MGQKINPELEEMIERLDEESVKELQLFVEFLLSKKEIPATGGKKKRGFLADMEEIPISLDNIIIDRAEIYGDRG